MLLPDAPSSPSVTLGWQSLSKPPRHKLPSAKPGLTTGASTAQRSRYESTPPSGRLVSDPPLHTGRNGFILFPLSRNLSLTNSGARVENDIGAELVQACGRVGKIYSSPNWATSGMFEYFLCCRLQNLLIFSPLLNVLFINKRGKTQFKSIHVILMNVWRLNKKTKNKLQTFD